MKRALVFLVAAPVTVFFALLLIWVLASGIDSLDFGCLVAAVLSILALPMAAISWAADEFISRDFSVPLRASLTAIVGATAVTAELSAVFSGLFASSIVTAFAIGGAIVVAVCSLLSNDHGHRQAHRFEPAGA